jgi:hypothetical protein
MKRILITLFAMLLLINSYSQKISALPSATTLTGNELINVVQGGISKKTTSASVGTAGGITGVAKSDSIYQKPGSYVPQYQFKHDVGNEEKNMLNKVGAVIKLAPAILGMGITSTTTMVSGTLYYELCYNSDTITISTLTYGLTTNGSFTGANYNGMGIYSVSGTTFTLLRSTTNNEATWKIGTAVSAVINLTSPITLPPGKYVIMALYNQSAQTTAPIMYGLAGGYQLNIVSRLPNSTYFNAYSAAATYTALPATIDATAFYTTSAGILIFGN